MAWPPTPTGGAAFIKRPSTSTVVFGTDGLMASLITKSARFTQRSEEIDLENGTGFEVVVYLLVKGESVDFTCVDDSGVSTPEVGDVVTLYTPFTPAGLQFLVIEPSHNAQSKQPGEVAFTAKSYTLVNLSI
jgi:hypothetical protein